MQLSCGWSAAAKPSSQPRSCRFKAKLLSGMGDLRDSPEAQEPATSGNAAASREPQALRPEGAIDVMAHLLCRTANPQSLAAGLRGLTPLEPYGQRPRVDEVAARAMQQPRPVPDPLGQPDPRDAVACP